MIFVLIGPPGSGKGTHSQFLSKKLKLPHVSTGDMLRKIVDSDEEEGRLAKQYMSTGRLVEASLVNKIVKKCLSSEDYKKGCILDGYPRSLEQAKFLETINKDVIVIYFAVDDQVIVKRILGRFNCSQCGKIYNRYYAKPQVDNKCDACGSDQFAYRTDDNEESITERLKVYKAETLPLIKYYQEHGHFYTVDAGKSIKEIESELNVILNELPSFILKHNRSCFTSFAHLVKI